ncbi:response regulator [Parvularcula sp. LCG005]|uniref:response regulator n=1 Tax=Parvularcula sp. LCG005 TaxID=3078805 RepID=UPI00294242ED|nr:response regulator [Parvularcula sp. LCG005]WOI52802.1 response regulator [Parvularcula sp. LCG005]
MSTILIVDDDAAVADVVKLVLSEAGHKCLVAHSPRDALDVVEKQSVDGIILDVWLGRDDGLDLAATLIERMPTQPFIIMSGGGPGRSLEMVTARADALGACSVLYKPFDDDELLTAVDAMLGGTCSET